MKNVKKIMVAFDRSEFSKQALRYACELADDLKADLIVTNVINQRDVDIAKWSELSSSGGILVEKFIDQQKKIRSDEIQKEIGAASCGHLSTKTVFRVGVPFHQLIQAAKDEGANLVVMGPKGRGNLPGILFGTTAEKMFRHCPVPVLSLRTGEYERGASYA